MDDNPFSFFLTSPSPDDEEFSFENSFSGEDASFFSDEDYELELDAGIETPESRSPVREVSPSSLQRESLSLSPIIVVHGEGVVENGGLGIVVDGNGDVEEDYEFGIAMPMSLRDFSAEHKAMRNRHRSDLIHDQGVAGLGLGLVLTSPRLTPHLTPPHSPRLSTTATTTPLTSPPPPARTSSRGRAKLRRPKLSRTVTGRRRSWGAPSPQMWTIDEDRECEEMAEKGEDLVKGCLLNGGRDGEQRSQPIDIPKVVKRVHWAC